MGWMVALGVLILLGLAPLGIFICYDQDGPSGKLVAGPVKILLFPRPRKQKSEKKPAPKREASAKPAPTPTAARDDKIPPQNQLPGEKQKDGRNKKGGSVTDFLPLVKIAFDFLGDFRRKLRVDLLEMKIVLAGGDPCSLALNYGKAWAAMGNLLPRLERFLVIKKRNLDIQCDFTGADTLITASVQITITLGRLLGLAAVYGFKSIKTIIPILKKRKGGNVK